MLIDRYGNPASTQSQEALDKYNDALELIRLYRGDPVAALDAALTEDPDFGGAWAARAGLLVQATDKACAEELDKSLRAGAASNLTERDRLHLAAAGAWAAGDYQAAVTHYGRVAQEHPRDLLALQYAHLGCFFLGLQHELRDWPLQTMRAFSKGDDGYGALLGMAAFGLEECGDYVRAEALGREGVEIDGRDAWSAHAVAHVNEMRGDSDEGMHWLNASSAGWADSGFAYHNWWHLALLHLDRDAPQDALTLYDAKVQPAADSQIVQEWIDGSALLWRLHLDGVNCGERFSKMADLWSRAAEDGYYAFNDLHAIMAFIGAGRTKDVERTLRAMRAAAQENGANAYMTRAVGLPLAEAFVDFAAGRNAACVEKIGSVRGIAQRFGGSHAQRDIISLTALHAATRAGMRQTADAFASERLTHKPHSPWARRLMKQAEAA
ncbi:MAG: tetratricopeptide repeat protein [Caulobacterales bacterium]